MAVILRLRRMGAKKKPIYRIVATDVRNKRDGRFIETVGQYDPNKEEGQVSVKADRVEHWLKSGAQLSDTVKSLLKKQAKTANQ